MKIILAWAVIFTTFFISSDLSAQTSQNSDEEFIAQYIQEEENRLEAREKSRNLLEEKPDILTLRENESKLLEEAAKQREELAHKIDEKRYLEDKKKMTVEDVTRRLEKAPFGLYWDATFDELKTMDFNFAPAKRENYSGVYIVQNPLQSHTKFQPILAIFGLQNHLWCIYAQSQPQEDKADASQVLRLYRQYYEALQKKYGQAKEFFTPYSYIEEKIEGEGDKKTVTQIKHTNPLGSENFLEELKTNKASLYATFENDKVGITLGVAVTEDDKSFITLDYKNFSVMKKEKSSNLENIMSDL